MNNPTPRDSAQLPPLPDTVAAFRDKGTFTMPEQFYPADVIDAREALRAQPASVEPIGEFVDGGIVWAKPGSPIPPSGTKLYAGAPPARIPADVGAHRNFVLQAQALIDLDAEGALVPHGIGGHARKLLKSAICLLSKEQDDAELDIDTDAAGTGQPRGLAGAVAMGRSLGDGTHPGRGDPEAQAPVPLNQPQAVAATSPATAVDAVALLKEAHGQMRHLIDDLSVCVDDDGLTRYVPRDAVSLTYSNLIGALIPLAALTAQALPAAEPWGAQPFNAPVYPPDGTKSPFTVINLGLGKVQMGDSIHDHRLPALWFGTNGQGMGHEEVMNREAKPGETLAVVTFSNVEGLDVLLEAVQRIRRESFPQASQQAAQATAGWVPTEQFIADLAMAIDTIDESAKSLRDGHTVGGRWVSLSPIDVEVKAIYEEEAALVNRLREVAAALPQPQPQSAQEDAA